MLLLNSHLMGVEIEKERTKNISWRSGVCDSLQKN